jgi:DEAD/DEAH box helicase domain-containing protein
MEGQLFQVERFDYDNRKAFVRAVECDYYTDAITYTKVTILETFASSQVLGFSGSSGSSGSDTTVAQLAAGLEDEPEHPSTRAPENLTNPSTREPDGPAEPAHGEVRVVSRVVGFKKIKFYTNENVGSGELDLPEQEMHTTSYWLTIPADTMASLPFGLADRRDVVIGLAYAMRNVAPLLLMCDSHDLGLSIDGIAMEGARRMGGSAKGASPAELSAAPTIFIYDNYPGGIGLSEPLFGMHLDLIQKTRELIDGCGCSSGCPSCVGPEGATGPQAKAVASRLLGVLTAAVRSAA